MGGDLVFGITGLLYETVTRPGACVVSIVVECECFQKDAPNAAKQPLRQSCAGGDVHTTLVAKA
jgi:hypothetical protein